MSNPATAISCPKCGSEKVNRRRNLRSVLGFGLLFILCLITSNAVPAHKTEPASALLVVSAAATLLTFVFLFATVLSVVSAAAGKNQCKSCKHKWR